MMGWVRQRPKYQPLVCQCECHKWLKSEASQLGTSRQVTVRHTHYGDICEFCFDEIHRPWSAVLDGLPR